MDKPTAGHERLTEKDLLTSGWVRGGLPMTFQDTARAEGTRRKAGQ